MGGGTYIRTGSSKNTSIIFSLREGVGALAEALKVFKVSDKFLLIFDIARKLRVVFANEKNYETETMIESCTQIVFFYG